jgi:hypothetical protein
MKPQVKEKWLNALRSGEYQQGRLSLRVENNFCCRCYECISNLNDTDYTFARIADIIEEQL